MSTWKLACACAVSDGVPRRSLYVALIVGTVLNLINQGDALLGAASVSWLKVVLTSGFPESRLGGTGEGGASLRLLSKPYRLEELARALREALDGGQSGAER